MRKNRAMRVAALLLALTLITSCFVGSTFAKYTTSANGFDNARVAYWGFNDDGVIELTNLFSTNYTDAVSSGEDDIIAPGTSGSATFTFAYTNNGTKTAPEVDYKITVTTTGSECAQDIKKNTSIVWYLDGQKAGSDGTWDELLTAISDLSKDCKANYIPDAFKADATHTVAWVWHIDGNDDSDTAMGNKPTKGEALGTVKLCIQIAAEQTNSTVESTPSA